jgi:hypothetical protein
MKKAILAFALMGCGAIAMAQEDSMDYNTMNANRTTLQSSTGNYNAYSTATSVPLSTQYFLIRDYPTVTNPIWEQSGNWYRASYLNNNRNMQVYYAPNGTGYAVALPVIQSWVPEDVVTSAISRYGNSIYAINKVRGANGQEVYQVTLLDKGEARSEYLSADGGSVAAVDVFLLPGSEMINMNSSSSNAAHEMSHPGDVLINHDNVITVDDGDAKVKTKTKIKHADGREIKTKTKNGKTTVDQTDNMPDQY